MGASNQQEVTQKDDPVAGRAVSVNILKGGVGKSAISMNLADRLAANGHDLNYLVPKRSTSSEREILKRMDENRQEVAVDPASHSRNGATLVVNSAYRQTGRRCG